MIICASTKSGAIARAIALSFIMGAMVVSGKIHVLLVSNLGGTETMTAHCKSKDDDLGSHTLSNGQGFGWSFHLNFFKTTLFWCNVYWKNFAFGFDAYRYSEDRDRCHSNCTWTFAPEGIYLWNVEANHNDFKYPWPKK